MSNDDNDVWMFFVSELDSKEEFRIRMREVVETLPRPVFIVMRYLFSFLNQSVVFLVWMASRWFGAIQVSWQRTLSWPDHWVTASEPPDDAGTATEMWPECWEQPARPCVVSVRPLDETGWAQPRWWMKMNGIRLPLFELHTQVNSSSWWSGLTAPDVRYFIDSLIHWFIQQPVGV